jgi:CelD/BcsL family acetyltransferase involved in cellulose biosynthesis
MTIASRAGDAPGDRMGGAGAAPLTVTLDECRDNVALEAEWLKLQAEAAAPFFLTWTWIGPWLSRLPPSRRPLVLRARREGQVVGLGLLLTDRCYRLRLLPLRCVHLHASGDVRHDDITIEHNGLLVARDGAAQTESAMISFLCSPRLVWDCVRIPGVATMPSLPDLNSLQMVVEQLAQTAYSVDLEAIRGKGVDHLSQVSRNTRSQIRRSIKAYGAFGPVTVTPARDASEALLFLDRLKTLHQRSWTARGLPGSFANPLFEAFHVDLIERGMPLGQVLLLRVHAGDQDIGYLYNFAHDGCVSAYQSGFNYDLIDKHSHPGMVSHALAIQHCADSGFRVYDFLAGEARYKQQLSTATYEMLSLSICRDGLSLRLQERWRALKRRLRPEEKPPISEASSGEAS